MASDASTSRFFARRASRANSYAVMVGSDAATPRAGLVREGGMREEARDEGGGRRRTPRRVRETAPSASDRGGGRRFRRFGGGLD